MKSILIVAPHADDETLGCGGTILKYIADGYKVHWLIITGMSVDSGFSESQISSRISEIEKVANKYKFTSVHQLNLKPAQLDTMSIGDVIAPISEVINALRPDTVFTAYRNDSHSDHQITFDAVMSATKTFRYSFVRKILAYETISETDFGMKPEDPGFKPNVFVDITNYLDAKLDILEIYESEVGNFPFPRSRKALAALSNVRGVQCNVESAEAFMMLKEIII